MAAFEVAKNGTVLGTVESVGESMALVQLMAFHDMGHAQMVGVESDAENESNLKFSEELNTGDVVTVRVFKADKHDPLGLGVPSVRQPPELPPGRNLL